MDVTSDDLTRPLGVDRRDGPAGRKMPVALAVCGVGLSLVAAAILYAVIFGDAGGGVPTVRTEIAATLPTAASRPATPEPATPPDIRPAAPEQPKGPGTSGTAIEHASGVTVVRAGGTAAPESIIIRIPDPPRAGLTAAPDPRLVDRTRYGPLPRLGPDGARPMDVYARPVGAQAGGRAAKGRVAIVVGGLGISQTSSADALSRLPGAVSLALAPYGADVDKLAGRARESGHEILLQIPMEPFDYPDSDPGPHTLTAAGRPAENLDHLHWAMGRLSGYVGIVNYMGGKLTSDERALAPILKDVGGRGLAFLDDGSSSRSVALRIAGDVPVARADLVLDAVARADAIDKALEKLEATALSGGLSGGLAIGTASALPLSIERIARWAERLGNRGIELVPVSSAFRAGSRPAETGSRPVDAARAAEVVPPGAPR